MNFKKLLVALSGIAMIGTPAATLVACKNSGGGTVTPGDEIKSLTAISTIETAKVDEITVSDPEAVVALEINTIFDKLVQGKVRALGGTASDAAKDVDYTITLEKDNGALSGSYNLTSSTDADRTFQVKVTAVTESKKVKGETTKITVVLPQLTAKVDLATASLLNFTFLDKPYALNKGITLATITAAPGSEIMKLFDSAVQQAVADVTNGVAVAKGTDYTYSISLNGTPVAEATNYNLDEVGGKDFVVTITATNESKVLKSATSELTVNVPKLGT